MKKKCTKCGKRKLEEEFYKNSGERSGYYTWCKMCANAHAISYQRIKKYGVDQEMYDLLLVAQKHRCLVCKAHVDDLEKALCVDHNHETGLIRGLLCSNCNVGLGNFRDNPDFLRRAADYIERADP